LPFYLVATELKQAPETWAMDPSAKKASNRGAPQDREGACIYGHIPIYVELYDAGRNPLLLRDAAPSSAADHPAI
jgi:hypothetical protein